MEKETRKKIEYTLSLFLASTIFFLSTSFVSAEDYICKGDICIYHGKFNLEGDKGSIIISPEIIPGCEERWVCSFTTCKDEKQTKICVDANNCGTLDFIPADNGSIQSCSVANGGQDTGNSNGGGGGGSGDGRSIIVSSENKSEVKTTGCIENWECSEWGACLNGEQVRTCTDKNNCGTIFLKPAVERLCENKFVADGKNNGFVSRILGAVIGLGSNPANLGIAAVFLVTILAAMLIVRAVRKKKAEVEAEDKGEED